MPGRQGLIDELAAGLGQKYPGRQGVQVGAPGSLYVPFGQVSSPLPSLCGQASPAAQGVHAACPAKA